MIIDLDKNQTLDYVTVVENFSTIKLEGGIRIHLSTSLLAEIVETYQKKVELNKLLESLHA